jgi:CubicO group peptidase (beta-lactamase class C family)
MPHTSYVRFAQLATLALVLITSTSANLQADNADSALAARMQRVEDGIPPIPLDANQPPLQPNLAKLMQLYKVPAVSIAVIDDFKIAWAKGYGVTEAGGNTAVTVHTLFQAASISKPVSATASLWLVEQGKLSLDENVNLKLRSWQVPENEFTKDQKVTLRRLLSHSAGLTVHGFPGYEADTSLPTLVQVLNGEPPANTPPVRVDTVPGTKFNYSGGGITIEQRLVMDVTGKPFPQFMRETVLDKIGVTDSTYEQPLPPARAAMAATATDSDGASVPGKWHIYPEMAAAGLWTTPTDLAKFAIEIALSKQGKANHVLSETMTREMLKPQIAVDGDESIGLGLFLGGYKNPQEFGHDGSNQGFRSLLAMFADSGKGVAIMVNSNNGVPVENALLQSVAKEYGWSYTPDPPSGYDLLALVATIKGPEAAIVRYSELKKSASPYVLDQDTLIQLGYNFLASGKTDAAIQAFKLEVEDYPKFWNAYDSLGEAYMKAGENVLAIENYQKSIELNPKNQNGIEMLKKLKEQK